MKKRMDKYLDLTENVLAMIDCFLLLFATFSIGAQVISRYFFNHPFMWVDEINSYILVYLPFLSVAWLARTSDHIAVDIIDSLLSTRMRSFNDMVIALIGIGVSFVLIWYGSLSAIDSYMRDIRSMTVLAIPKVYVISIIPIGSFVLLLEFFRKLYQAFQLNSRNNALSSEEPELKPIHIKEDVLKEG